LLILKCSPFQIDEPDTPFRYRSDSETSGLSDPEANGNEPTTPRSIDNKNSTESSAPEIKHEWESLNAKLQYHESMQQDSTPTPISAAHDLGNGHSNHTLDSNGEFNSLEKRTHDNFKDKRAAHYNEFLVLRAARGRLSGGLDDGDEDDGEVHNYHTA